MVDEKRYLIVKHQDVTSYSVKLAYWFDMRVDGGYVYPSGFYSTKHRIFPHKNVIWHIAIDDLPKFSKWKSEEPIVGEKYLVYRVGYSPHYTIRKYHNGSFGSKDVKYWIKLSHLLAEYVELKEAISQRKD